MRLFRAANEPKLAAETQVDLATALRDYGDTGTSRTLLEEAIPILEAEGADGALVRALIARTRDLQFTGHVQEGLAAAERTLAMALEHGMMNEAARASQLVGLARIDVGDLEGIGELERALQMCLKEALSSSITVASYINLALCKFVLAGARGSLELFQEGIDYAERRGRDSLWTRGATLWPLFELGAWDGLLERAEELLAEDDARGGSQLGVVVRTSRSRVPIFRGELLEVTSLAEQFLPEARTVGDTQILAPALAVAALLYHAVGDVTAAMRLMKEWLHETEGQPFYLAFYLTDAARVLASRERRLLEEAIEATRRYASPRARNSVLTASAVVAEVAGDTKEAQPLYQDAALGWADFGYPLEEAQALFGAARCSARLGNQNCIEQLESARQIFVELGARPLVSDVDAWIADGRAVDSS